MKIFTSKAITTDNTKSCITRRSLSSYNYNNNNLLVQPFWPYFSIIAKIELNYFRGACIRYVSHNNTKLKTEYFYHFFLFNPTPIYLIQFSIMRLKFNSRRFLMIIVLSRICKKMMDLNKNYWNNLYVIDPVAFLFVLLFLESYWNRYCECMKIWWKLIFWII